MSSPDPNPYLRPQEPTLGPAPVPVMEQIFWIELAQPPEIATEIETPPGVTLLDRTKPGTDRTRTRLYFRSDRGIEHGEIIVKSPNHEPVRIPLHVRTYRQDIEEQTRTISDLDPTARKCGPSYYTDDIISRAKENLRNLTDREPEQPSEAAHRENQLSPKEVLSRLTPYDNLSDEELFQTLPAWNIPRSCYSNWPCPHCGTAIFQDSGYYPWKLEPEHPYKARCPKCKQLFPSNNFSTDDLTSGNHPDDGWGWDPGSGKRSEHAGWIAHYTHMYWRAFGNHIPQLAQRYLLFNDQNAAHRIGVLLSRMAYVYPGLNMRWQQVDDHYLRPGRLLLDGNWERNEILVPVCRAYDALFHYLDEDHQLVEFLQTKDAQIQSPNDVKALIETYLLQLFGWDWIQRELSGGNMGAREEDMAQFAVCANMGPISDRWIEELFTHAYNGGLDKGGFDDETLVNTATREGIPWISGLGYAYGYLVSKSDMAEILSRVESPQWKARCNLYDPTLYPKFRAEFDTWIDLLVAGQFGPGYGDSGDPRGHRYPRGIPADLRQAYARAYRHWPTDKLARAIYQAGRGTPDIFEPDIWPQIESHVQKIGPEPRAQSRVLDGAGFVLLESRPEAEDLNQRAGLVLRYGYARGHHHQDNLSVELFANGLSLTPDLGYPCWAHPMGNTAHVAHHITGMIDRNPQYKSAIARGTLEAFSATPETSFADVSAQPDGFPNRTYRRALCLTDAPDGNVYLLDILRLAGGTTRTWCFHGPPYDGFDSNLKLSPESTEPFEISSLGRDWSNNIANPQSATTGGQAWADWKYNERDTHLRIHLLAHPGRTYTTAACAKPDIPPIRYLFAEDEETDGASEFISIWQPYETEPFIERVERLSVEGAHPGEFQPIVIRVTLKNGQQDTFFYSTDPTLPFRCGRLTFQGSFGYWSEQNGSLRALHLFNGRSLRKGNEGIVDLPPSFQATLLKTDYVSNLITLNEPLPGDIENDLIYIHNSNRSVAYHITEVLPSRTEIRLDLNAMIYRSRLIEAGDQHLVCETPPPVETSREFKPGYYNGAALTGEDHKAQYRVTHIENDHIYLDRPVQSSDFPDTDGDGRRLISMFDFGPGDKITIHRSAYIQPGERR